MLVVSKPREAEGSALVVDTMFTTGAVCVSLLLAFPVPLEPCIGPTSSTPSGGARMCRPIGAAQGWHCIV
jgi:hypothetical protein